MLRSVLIALSSLSLVSCLGLNDGIGGVATPQRCEDAIRNVQTLEALAKLLPSFGINAHDSASVAQALAEGRVSIQAVCDFARQNDGRPLPSDPAV